MPKSRYTTFSGPLGKQWTNNRPVTLPPNQTWNWTLTGLDKIQISQGNAYHKLGRSPGKIGGAFLVEKREAQVSPTEELYAATINQPSSAWKRYKGRFATLPGVGVGDFPSAIIASSNDLDAAGTTAIANVLPTNPISGLSVTLGELRREGIPSIPLIGSWKGRTGLAKSAGSEYLNKEFGWDPLIGDIRSFWRTAHSSEELIKHYARNSGRKIHRSYHWPVERSVVSSTTDVGYTGNIHPTLDITYFANSPRKETTEIIEKTRWFEGCFTYHLPPLDPSGGNGRRNRLIAKKLYGLEITPEVVWNLTPWSWAADWVGNFGDVFHNIGAFRDDGLVMHYGYVMDKIVHKVEYTTSDIRTKSEPTKRRIATTVLSTTTKQRRSATPYGFGLDNLLFSNRQLSILSALGISRS